MNTACFDEWVPGGSDWATFKDDNQGLDSGIAQYESADTPEDGLETTVREQAAV